MDDEAATSIVRKNRCRIPTQLKQRITIVYYKP